MIRIAICIATFQRPQGLSRLLESLSNLRFEKQDEPSIKIVIVDNDSNGTAKPVVDYWRNKLRWTLVYEIEPRRGISYARNRLVALVKDMDFVAFIDDDEVASDFWIDELLYTQKKYQADIVTGPVLPFFEVSPPRWIIKGKFFERRYYDDGEHIKQAITANVLIANDLLSWIEGPFDLRVNLAGGGDSLLFYRLLQHGAFIVFSSQAVVEEFTPQSRMTVKWLCQRAYRGGNSYTLILSYIQPSKKCAIIRLIKGLGRIAQGIVLLFSSIVIGRLLAVKALQNICLGAGSFSGVFGYKYLEYKKKHGK
jgi:glycosyltransferase involved in cell wall biosynthesis